MSLSRLLLCVLCVALVSGIFESPVPLAAQQTKIASPAWPSGWPTWGPYPNTLPLPFPTAPHPVPTLSAVAISRQGTSGGIVLTGDTRLPFVYFDVIKFSFSGATQPAQPLCTDPSPVPNVTASPNWTEMEDQNGLVTVPFSDIVLQPEPAPSGQISGYFSFYMARIKCQGTFNWDAPTPTSPSFGIGLFAGSLTNQGTINGLNVTYGFVIGQPVQGVLALSAPVPIRPWISQPPDPNGTYPFTYRLHYTNEWGTPGYQVPIACQLVPTAGLSGYTAVTITTDGQGDATLSGTYTAAYTPPLPLPAPLTVTVTSPQMGAFTLPKAVNGQVSGSINLTCTVTTLFTNEEFGIKNATASASIPFYIP